jgi:predicted PurR-regulated permease PerM
MVSSRPDTEEHFRKRFVLTLTLVLALAFLVMIRSFAEALMLGAVFSGIVYPLYRRFMASTGGRSTVAAMLTLLITLVAILLPLILLLGLVAEQAIAIAQELKPWIEQRLQNPSGNHISLPAWLPFSEDLEPYQAEMTTKAAELARKSGEFLGGSLIKLTEGTAIFFLYLFIMLYAMFYFLTDGPTLIKTITGYFPLSQGDKEKMTQVGLSVSRATIKGTLVIALIQGALGGLGFAVAGIDNYVFWAAVMAVLSVVPGIGAMLVWVPVVAYLMMTGQMGVGVGLLLWCALVVGSVDNFLRPVLVGRDTEMPDLLILLSTLGGISFFGAAGLVLGPMLAALLITVLAIYNRVFADWLDLDQPPDETPAEE